VVSTSCNPIDWELITLPAVDNEHAMHNRLNVEQIAMVLPIVVERYPFYMEVAKVIAGIVPTTRNSETRGRRGLARAGLALAVARLARAGRGARGRSGTCQRV
jgi:hypothetical protein